MVDLEVLSHSIYDGPSFVDGAGGGNFDYETMINTIAVRGSFRF